MSWRTSVFAETSFPSFDACPSIALSEDDAAANANVSLLKETASGRVEFPGSYFLPCKWIASPKLIQRAGANASKLFQKFQDWVDALRTHVCDTTAESSQEESAGSDVDSEDSLDEVASVEDDQDVDPGAEDQDVDVGAEVRLESFLTQMESECPEELIENYQTLVEQPVFLDNIIKATKHKKTLKKDPVLVAAANELGYDLEKTPLKQLCASNFSKFDNCTLWSAVSSYKSVYLPLYNIINNEHVARLVALHLTRHIYSYSPQGVYADDYESLRRNTGWTNTRCLVLSPTKLHGLLWLRRFLTLAAPEETEAEEPQSKRARKQREAFRSRSEGALKTLIQELSDVTESGEVDEGSQSGVSLLANERRKEAKPLDYIDAFRGNNDDDFIYGLKYTNRDGFYVTNKPAKAAIVVCSPSVLSQLIATGRQNDNTEATEKNDSDDEEAAADAALPCVTEEAEPGLSVRETYKEAASTRCTWLSSIEICVVDRADQMLQNNYNYLIRIFGDLNLPPRWHPRGVNITSLRPSHVDSATDDSVFYRQTIMLSQHADPLLQSLLTKSDANHRGLVKLWRGHDSSVAKRVVALCAGNFMTVSCDESQSTGLSEVFQSHFVDSFHSRLIYDQVLIVVPSIVESIQVENMLKNGVCTDAFQTFNENDELRKLSIVRKALREGRCPILVVTERVLYYRRFRFFGYFHVIWYGAPKFAHIFLDTVESAMVDPKHVGDEKESKSAAESHLALIYWNPNTDAYAMERIVGLQKVHYLMTRSKCGSIFSVAHLL